VSQLADALSAIKWKIVKYDPEKQRPVSTNKGTMSIEKFIKLFQKDLGPRGIEFPEVFKALHDNHDTENMLTEYAEEVGVLVKSKEIDIEIPAHMKNLVLNLNLSAKGKDDKFFLTHPDETIARVSGDIYLLLHQMPPIEAAAAARKVIPEYMPRAARGVSEIKINDKVENVFNMYIPPAWRKVSKKVELPDKLPAIFEKLVNHLFPLKEEREYFYAWLHDSLFKRSFVFLVICGAPGTGKNRLKLVLRALHGHVNTVDGKKSTLTERFNSQLGEATLAWFDELHYDMDMENTMKELQNDSISIERKGVDATRATKIYSSIVISNNKPRDNYIAFDARKFAPLVVAPKRLEVSMTPAEIDAITQKVEDETSETFDVKFLAQIARWVKKHGASKKWPNLEYRGPMFWMLAHTSMSRWQKKAALLVLEPPARGPMRGLEADSKRGFLWSQLAEKATKKHGDRSLQFPDFTSVRAFFEVFRDSMGRKAFETEPIPDSIMGDFYVRSLFKKTEIITEASIIEQRGKENAKEQKEHLDL
jgi:hypothetical protein